MNTYLYAPKDDYKHRMYWRELYTSEEAGKKLMIRVFHIKLYDPGEVLWHTRIGIINDGSKAFTLSGNGGLNPSNATAIHGRESKREKRGVISVPC